MKKELTNNQIKYVMANYLLFAATFKRMSKKLYEDAHELYESSLNAFEDIEFAFNRVVRFVECH